MEALHAHIAAVRLHPLLAGRDIDFKLAAGGGVMAAETVHETGFDTLSVRKCKVCGWGGSAPVVRLSSPLLRLPSTLQPSIDSPGAGHTWGPGQGQG